MTDTTHNEKTALGDCFKVAADLVVPSLGIVNCRVSNMDDIALVHGIVTGKGRLDGIRFTHAWVEGVTADGITMVVDISNGLDLVIPKELYYGIGRIDPGECERYSAKDAIDRMLSYAHYGPWDGAPVAHPEPRNLQVA